MAFKKTIRIKEHKKYQKHEEKIENKQQIDMGQKLIINFF